MGPFRRVFDNPYLLLALCSLFWSGNHIIGRAVAGEAPPLGISTARWFFGALLLWPLARPHLERDWPAIRRHWKIVLYLCLTGGALFSALQYVGLQLTTAMNTSVLNSILPVFIVGAAALLFRDPVTSAQLLGIATSLLGVLVVVTRGELGALASLAFNAGDLVIVFNMAVMAFYSACLRLLPRIHWLSFLFLIATISVAATAPFFAWEHFSGFRFQATPLTFLTVAYVAVFPSVLAFAAYNRGIELIGAARAGVFSHLIPLYTALLATFFLGERLAPFHLLGFALILAGVFLAGRRG